MRKNLGIEDFENYLRDGERSENTIDGYKYDIKAFFATYPEINKKNMLAFKQQQMERWKPKTAARRILAMNRYCEFLGHPEWKVKRIKIHKNTCVENVITVDEYHRLLDGLQKDGNEKGYWIIKYLAKTGARVSEFTRLTKSGLKKGYCEMWTKGKIRRIYIPQSLIEESRDYFNKESDSDYLFLSQMGKPYTTRGIDANIKHWGKKYGIRKEVLYPHSFRHLYAIEFLKKNSNIALLADLMGHSSVSTTSIYLRLSKAEQMEQFNQASDW